MLFRSPAGTAAATLATPAESATQAPASTATPIDTATSADSATPANVATDVPVTGSPKLLTSTWSNSAIAALVVPALILLIVILL